MKSLEQQGKEDKDKSPIEVLLEILERLGWEERGGGPEGIYYTHPIIEGEFLLRNLPSTIMHYKENK